MKKRIIVLSVLCAILITVLSTTCHGVTSPKFNDERATFEEYVEHYGDAKYVNATNLYYLIYKKYGIYGKYNQYSPINNSYIISATCENRAKIDRTTALVALMRVNMLIPNNTTVNEYTWTDAPKNLDKLYIDYINYAKQLNITKGTGDTSFGFRKPVTFEQILAFMENIEKIENISQYQCKTDLEINSNCSGPNIDKMAIPIVVEFYNTLPKNIKNAMVSNKWSVNIVLDRIPEYDESVFGLTSPSKHKLYVRTKTTNYYYREFYEVLIHEIGHIIDYESGFILSNNVDQNIKNEITKLSTEYRHYASSDIFEYFACAWCWMNMVGEKEFVKDYPYTYQYIMKSIDAIK